MVEDIEMSSLTQNADKVDAAANSSSKQKTRLFQRLNSNLCIATVLSFYCHWEVLEPFFARLSKKGPIFLQQHRAQFRYFIEDKKVQRLDIDLDDRINIML